MKKKHLKIFLIWMALLNWPPVLIWIPFCRILCLVPYLLWINVPASWFGLAKLIGKPHYKNSEFGVMPLTPLSWILIAVFWCLLAIGLTAITAQLSAMRERKKQTTKQD